MTTNPFASSSDQKKNLRRQMKRVLAALRYDRKEIAERLFAVLTRVPEFQDAKIVAAFVDFQNEIPTKEIIERIMNKRRSEQRVVVPACFGKEMKFYRLLEPREGSFRLFDDLAPNDYGVPEPTEENLNRPNAIVDPQEIDCILVPGLAFDRAGGRLGRGAGYYDRFLPSLRPDAAVVGLCFDEQLVDRVPIDRNDFRIPRVAAPSQIVETKRRE